MTAFENGERAGYVIHGKVRKNTRILQIVVADDARRVEHATALVDAVTRLANAVRAHSISLHCAQDLDANRYWKAIGFKIAGKRLRDKRGRRWQNKWEITLPGAAEDAILASKRLDVAGISALHRLLVKGDARIGDVNFARFRSSKHHLLLHADDA
jgi:ribosomal protein S18 acetylase RimI-like enzyme